MAAKKRPTPEDAATARRDWGDRAEAWGYTFRTLLESGAVLPFGTDAPVEPIDAWPGIAIAVTVLTLNVFGDGVRDALDPRSKLRIGRD